jgi:putative flippase GtrA
MALPTGEILRFGVTGLIATAVHLAAFAVQVDGVGMPPAPANALAVLIAGTVTYLGQRFWVFPGHAGPAGPAQIARFAVALGLAAGLHAAVLQLAVTGLGAGPYAGAVLGLVIVPPASFLLNRAWVFRRARPARR